MRRRYTPTETTIGLILSTLIFSKNDNRGSNVANKVKGIKAGMGGSKCGKGRTEKTADMKKQSKKARRAQGKAQAQE